MTTLEYILTYTVLPVQVFKWGNASSPSVSFHHQLLCLVAWHLQATQVISNGFHPSFPWSSYSPSPTRIPAHHLMYYSIIIHTKNNSQQLQSSPMMMVSISSPSHRLRLYDHDDARNKVHVNHNGITAPHSTLVSLLCVWAASSGLSALPRAS